MFRLKSAFIVFVCSSIAVVVGMNMFVDLEMAIAYWNIVLHDRFKFLDLWSRYLVVSALLVLLELLLIFGLISNALMNLVFSY